MHVITTHGLRTLWLCGINTCDLFTLASLPSTESRTKIKLCSYSNPMFLMLNMAAIIYRYDLICCHILETVTVNIKIIIIIFQFNVALIWTVMYSNRKLCIVYSKLCFLYSKGFFIPLFHHVPLSQFVTLFCLNNIKLNTLLPDSKWQLFFFIHAKKSVKRMFVHDIEIF